MNFTTPGYSKNQRSAGALKLWYFRAMLYKIPIAAIVTSFLFMSCKENAAVHDLSEATAKKDTIIRVDSDTTPLHRFPVYISNDHGQSWTSLSEGLPKDAQGSCIRKVGNEILLATDNAGLFVTQNNMTSWKDIGQGLMTKKINTLFVDGDEIYIGLFHEGVSMRKLKEGYWNSYNSNLPNRNIRAIVKVKDELIVGTDMGIFKSEDHMSSWNGKHLGEQCSSLNLLGKKIIAGTVKGVLMSIDGGETWKYVHKGGAIHNATVEGNNIYAMYTSGDVFVSDTSGRRWREIIYAPREKSYVYDVAEHNGQILMSNNDGVLFSKNKGREWQVIFPEKRFVFMDFLVDGDKVYGCTRSRK